MIFIADEALTFRCDEDSQASDHAISKNGHQTLLSKWKWLKAFNVGSNSFDVNVGTFR